MCWKRTLTGGFRPVRARSRHIREPTAGDTYDAAGERGRGDHRWGLRPVDGGERPFGDAGKFPPSVEAVWTRIRAKEWKAGATSARPHECGAVDDAKPRNRAHIWPLASTPDQNGAHKRCHGRKRRLFGAPAVPDAADTVPTASAIIDMPGNESDGVRLAISGAPGRSSARVTRPKSPNAPLAGAPEPLQPPKPPGEPPPGGGPGRVPRVASSFGLEKLQNLLWRPIVSQELIYASSPLREHYRARPP